MRPEVSVVIPTRNRWALLQLALRCALEQQDVEVEVIIVDDGSADHPPPELEHPADPRVKLLRLARAGGVAHARNVGVAAARGQWISPLDDDDLWAPDKLRRQIGAADGAGFVYASAVVFDEDSGPVTVIRAPMPSTLARDLLQRNVIPAGASNVMIRADTLREVGSFDHRFAHLDDWDLWIRLAAQARPAASDEVLVAQRRHGGNRFVDNSDGLLEDFRTLAAKHHTQAEVAGVSFDGLDFARWVAHGHRRGGHRLASARSYLRAGIKHRDLMTVVRGAAAVVAGPPRERRLTTAERFAWLPEADS